MNDKDPVHYTFPRKFWWGAATSSHQVEGGTHNQWSVWELENARSLAKQAEYKLNWLPHWDEIKDQATDPNNYVSSKATDHYNRYEQDFDIIKNMGLNMFRFSIEWSRIEPAEGVWDQAEIDHYKKYIAALKKRGIEPMMTLFHWTVPVWFEEKGAFGRRRNVKYFVRFVEKVIMELGHDVRYLCIINEPDTYTFNGWNRFHPWPWIVPGGKLFSSLWTYANLAKCVRDSSKLIRKASRKYMTGVSLSISNYYAGDDAWLSRLTARIMHWFTNRLFLNMCDRGLNWIGINYYFSRRVYGYKVHEPDHPVNDLGWYMQPGDIEYVIEDIYDAYKKPVIITESGVADRHDKWRKWWISESIGGIHRAMQNGALVEGYLHWSLLDNFEWAYGKWPKFGLIQVDYNTFKRTPRQSAVWYSKMVKKFRGKQS